MHVEITKKNNMLLKNKVQGKGGGGGEKEEEEEKKSKAWNLNLKYIIHKQSIILDKNISNSTKIHWP